MVLPETTRLSNVTLTTVPSSWCQGRPPWVQFSPYTVHCGTRDLTSFKHAFGRPWRSLRLLRLRLYSAPVQDQKRIVDGEKGAAGSAVRTLMTKQESEKASLARVVPLSRRPIWKRLVDKSPRPPRSWTGTWSGGRAIPESCGPNTPTCQQRFGWKWRWRLSISSACLWLLLYWWFIMFFSGHRIHITTSPAQRYPTAPSAHPGSDETHRH